MIKCLLALLFICSSVSAKDYTIDFGVSEVEHAWRGYQNNATFRPKMKSVGLSYQLSDKYYFRAAYGRLTRSGTLGRFDDLILEMDYIISYEIGYKHKFENLSLFAGIGTYRIPASVRSNVTDYYDHDYDNDEGYFLGAEYAIGSKYKVGYRFNMYSRIKVDPYDEWTKGGTFYLSYGF